jgi:hypothetical protein
MLQLEHKRGLVEACYPESLKEARELWHDIKPVKFGETVNWAAGVTTFAQYQIPEDAAYMIILRVEMFATTYVAAAPGFGSFSPPPDIDAFWQYTDVSTATNAYRLTNAVILHLLADTDEFLIAKGDHSVALIGTIVSAPDANARVIQTTVYAYLIGALVAGRIGDSESTYFSAS